MAMLNLPRLFFHIHTLWLFTYSDLKTTVFPSTAFALSIGLAKSLPLSDNNLQMTVSHVFQRVPSIVFWSWINLLAFNVSNQRLPHAIVEDALNKSWRPLPSQRLSPSQASAFVRVAYPIAVFSSRILGGGTIPSLLLAGFGYCYNDLRYGDNTAIIRNVLNGCFFTSFAAGALQVALQSPIDSEVIMWLGIIGLLVFSTIHIQDLYDQIGDSAAGRFTIPLILGDGVTRYTIIGPLIMWSYVCPRYWNTGVLGYSLVGLAGGVIAGRLLGVRTVEGDRTTFLIYNGWLMSIYMLPLIASLDGVSAVLDTRHILV